MKLVPNWYGPFWVIFVKHQVYRIEIKTQNGTFTNVITRDRIKSAKNHPIISNFNENIFMETESMENNIDNVHCTEQGYSGESDNDNDYRATIGQCGSQDQWYHLIMFITEIP